MFKQNVENQGMDEMPSTTARLFEALLKVGKIDAVSEPGKAAEYLNEPNVATITNWRNRGMSAAGVLKACVKMGLNPKWMVDGQGEMLWGDGPPAPTLEQSLNVFVDALMAAKQRKQAYAQLGVLMEGDSPLMRQTLLALLTQGDDVDRANMEAAA